jgi:membrane associated rhomboid family serine protease
VTSHLWLSMRRNRTPATFVLLGLIAVVYVVQYLTGDELTYALAFYEPLLASEPWRLITSAFAHGGIVHIMFNGYSLWVLGNVVERIVGSARFVLIFFASVIAGCIAVVVMDPSSVVIGASAGVFGLFAAMFIINRGFGGSNVSLLVIIGLNLAIGFVVPGISWQAHLGGLVGGATATLFLTQRRRR